jgi:hypothetical protein
MRKVRVIFVLGFLCLAGCSPRQFLTRRLATELISNSDAFRATQRFWLRTGVVSNKDYISPEYLVMQRRGWINGSNTSCPPEISPPPCWDVAMTPAGVEAFRDLIQGNAADSNYFSVPAAKRQLVSVTGISKGDQLAQVDFVWKWTPLNSVGEALYAGDVQYASTVGFRHYDDGWRVIEGNAARPDQSLDDSLKTAQPAQ